MTYLGGAGAAGAGAAGEAGAAAGAGAAGAAAGADAGDPGAAAGIAAAACLSCVGEPGTTCVLTAGFLAARVVSDFSNTAFFLAASLKPIFARFSVCALRISAVLAVRSSARGSNPSFEPLMAWITMNSTAKPAKAPSTHRKVAPALGDGSDCDMEKSGDQLTTFTDSMRRGSRHGYRLYLARPRR